MEWLQHASYLGIVLALLAAGFGLPIPEDIPLLTAGFLCHTGRARLVVMLPLTLIGVLGCDFFLFAVGRRFGDHVLEHRWIRRFFARVDLGRVKDRFHRHGAKIVVAGRFMPGARAMIFASAGVVGLSWWKFVLADGLAALVSVPVLVLLGWYFGEKSETLLADVRHAEHYVIAGVIVIALVVVLIESRRSRRLKEAAFALGNDAALLERDGAGRVPGPPAARAPEAVPVRSRPPSAGR